jgi:bifunctional DNA-binding transcriptional regulator/antitoxin component of YhaV-PrlF toxin-antitoxin module
MKHESKPKHNHPAKKKFLAGSIEDVSILRKFTILFLLMSVIPIAILFYLYVQIKEFGTVQIDENVLNRTLMFVIVGVVVGYFSMRGMLKRLISLTDISRKALKRVLGPEKLCELGEEKNEIAVLSESFSEINAQLEENVRNLELARKTLHSVMAKVGQGITNMSNIDTFLELILETVVTAMNGTCGALLLVDTQTNDFWIRSVYGVTYDLSRRNRYKIDPKSSLAVTIKEKKPRIFLEKDPKFVQIKDANFISKNPLVCAPLVIHDTVTGIIVVCGRGVEDDFDEDELSLLYNLASQTAVAIENSRLNKDIEKTYFETISALALAVDAKDRYSRGHLDRVADYAVNIAKKLGLEEWDVKILKAGARLHDLGKIGIPDEVLRKRGALDEQEWLLMRKHTEIGESIIKPVRSLAHLCDIIRHHHEKLDGTGYPDGLKDEEITPLVRIIAVADIYDALTTDRSYRERMSSREACKIMKEMKREIDQDIVDALIETLDEEVEQGGA